MTWNGSNITGPVLIYLDEILVDDSTTAAIGDPDRAGALICRSEDRARVSWHFTNGTLVSTESTAKQIRTGKRVVPSVSRLSLSREGVVVVGSANGLWHCCLDSQGGTFDEQINVGIYSRGTSRLLCNCSYRV